MKRYYTTLLLALSALTMPLLAQDVDETFVFMNEDYEIIENGATITRNQVEVDEIAGEIIKAGIYVLDNGAAANEVLVMHYTISQLDNGAFQICFPSTCNSEDAVGEYATQPGTVLYGFQDIQSEWLPVADGMCVVNLLIEVQTKTTGFPPRYDHKAYGPSITLRFVKGDEPTPPEPIKGDVNGDGEVNIADVNDIINMVLTDAIREVGDVNGDGEINISDINTLIDIILNQ